MMSPWNTLQEMTWQTEARKSQDCPYMVPDPSLWGEKRDWAGAGPVRERSSFLGNRADSEMVKCATTATERTAVWQKEWRHWRRQVVCLLSQRSIRGCLPLEEGQGLGRHRCAFPPSLPWPQKQWKQNCRGLPRTSGVFWPQIASPLLLFWYFLYLTWLFMLAIWLV